MKILLVDDEPGLVEAWRELLGSSAGFDVRIAHDGEAALREARSWPGGPDVLVTDVVMDPMDGLTLRETLAAEFPAMRAVFVSGYDLSGYADRTAGARVLPKPVDAGQLSAAISGAEPPMVGRDLGGYLVQEHLGRQGAVDAFVAWQGRMSRHVVLNILDEESSRLPAEVEGFLADARAKAAVSHPYLLAVHEAGESGGRCFYASDYLPGYSLEAYRAAGQRLDDRALVAALRTVADVSAHFATNGIARRALRTEDLIFDASMRPRLVNVAVAAAPAPDERAEVAHFAAAVAQLAAPGGAAASAAQALAGAPDWAAVSAAAVAAKPVVVPKDARKLTARSEKSKEIIEQSKKQQKKRVLISAAMTVVLLVVAAFALLRVFGGSERVIPPGMVKIPAGDFVYQDGEKVNLPEFWIDRHEVSIADYKEFLDFLEANPGEAKKFAHPDMPEGKSHVPLDWADDEKINTWGFYRGATRGSWKKIFPITLDHPVFNVDWFDAYAYAKWKGRRLPTEQEWEKAARGTDGRKFPWGNEEDPKKANTGADFKSNPKEGGEIDGHRRWARVDQPEGDKSPFGVRGTAGNVSEWTATWAPSEDGMGGEVPVVRGGNWGNPEHVITRRRAILDPLQQQDALGFRTVSDTKP
ncbi:MAG: SUMF1/EgtB/PvdO family nonheme iron enzyme [Chthoniobacterales bacterium]